jgi:hypothetical protein
VHHTLGILHLLIHNYIIFWLTLTQISRNVFV